MNESCIFDSKANSKAEGETSGREFTESRSYDLHITIIDLTSEPPDESSSSRSSNGIL